MNNRSLKNDLDNAMKNISLTPERRNAILRKAAAKPSRAHRMGRKIALACALAAALTVTAFAANPSLQEALKNILGGYFDNAQHFNGAVAEYDGIEVRPVAALADSGLARIYCEVQDKTGDRLGDDMHITYDITNILSHTELNTSVFGAEVASYDESTHTALVCLEQQGLSLEDELPCTLTFISFQPRDLHGENSKYELCEDLPGFKLPSEIPQDLKTKPANEFELPYKMPLPHEQHIMLPEQNPYPIGSDYMRISSLGFGDDGLFHIVFAFSGEANHENGWPLFAMHDSRTGDYIQGENSFNFNIDGTWYVDSPYAITTGDLPYIYFEPVKGIYALRDTIHGEWSVDVTIKPVEGALTYNPNVKIGEALASEVRVSPLSVIVISESDRTTFSRRTACATLADGTVLDLTENSLGGFHSIDKAYDQWTFDKPVEPGDVVSITINGVTVPLRGFAP